MLVEDSPDDAVLVLRAIEEAGYEVTHTRVENGAAMSAALDAGPWDVVVSAHRLAQFSSSAALELLHERGLDLPFIIASGTIRDEEAVTAMKAGAHDYVMKGHLARLGPAIARELREAQSRADGRRASAAEAALKLSETQLRQAQKMEAIGRLAGGIAHDFNNLLTAILGYSELLLAAVPEDNPIRRDLVEIKNAGERAAALTRQLLAFSRQQVLEPQILDADAVVRNMDQLLRRLIGEDIRLVTQFDSNLSRVKADPGQLEQVIMNLALNARDAMPDGGRLTISTANVHLAGDDAVALGAPAGPYVLVSVADTGIGMDAETQGRVFEPFFTTKGPTKGTGLGLSTVYGIVQQSKGFLSLSSEVGRGTTLRLYLPAVDAPLPAEPRRAAAAATSHAGAETILIAEDEAAIRNILRTVLTRGGYQLIEAASGEEALESLGTNGTRIDLLISDVVMPGLSGPELAARVRALQPDVRVLYLSGYSDAPILGDRPAGETHAFLAKPFSAAALTKKVRQLLKAPTES